MWGATSSKSLWLAIVEFQSTHPVWGATVTRPARGLVCRYFNPRTPCGVRPLIRSAIGHPPKFQSTHPVWGATPRPRCTGERQRISIHAPRVGCDSISPCCSPPCSISIHAPRVGCDACREPAHPGDRISIHAPRVGCDPRSGPPLLSSGDFNPRTPCGVRPADGEVWLSPCINFNPRTPCGVRPPHPVLPPLLVADFNPRTPCGVRLRAIDRAQSRQ